MFEDHGRTRANSSQNRPSSPAQTASRLDRRTFLKTVGASAAVVFSSQAVTASNAPDSEFSAPIEGNIPAPEGDPNKAFETYHDFNPVTTAWVSYRIRLEPGFEENGTWNGKLPGFSGRKPGDAGAGGDPADGVAWSARMGFEPRADRTNVNGVDFEFYLYHMDQETTYGDHDQWEFGPEEDVWYEIEQELRLGTPGENADELRAWVDNSLEYERTDLNFREDGGNDILNVWWHFMHGGDELPTDTISAQFDDLTIRPHERPE